MQRSLNLILETGKTKTKPGQNTNEFNCVDSMAPLIWTPVTYGLERSLCSLYPLIHHKCPPWPTTSRQPGDTQKGNEIFYLATRW
jgi:hypothetical protein